MFKFNFKSPSIHRTPLYRARAAYANMLRRCENKCGDQPSYANVKLLMSKDEWLRWSLPRYRKFLRRYPNESPSVSRKGDEGHYEIGNIEIIPWSKNRSLMATPGRAVNGKKRCSTCKAIKPICDFTKKTAAKDGLHHQCKACCKIQAKLYNSKKEVQDRRRERRKN